MAKIDIKYNSAEVMKILRPVVENGLELTTINVLDSINALELVPRRSGTLEKSAKVSFNKQSLTGYISWNTPYVDRLWYGIDFKFLKVFNKNARSKWSEVVTTNKSLMQQILKKSFKKKKGR